MRNVIVVVVCLGLGMAALPLFMYGPFGRANFAAPKKTAATDGQSVPPGLAQRSLFPDELAPLGEGRAVTKAAEWKRSEKPVVAVLKKGSGELHRWHQYLKEKWRSYSVENTELALVVDVQHKQHINTVYFQGNAPPVHRYRYHVDVWLVEAKTGVTISQRRFVSYPRRVKSREPWKLTALGQQVRWQQVRQWLEGVVDDFAERDGEETAAGDKESNRMP